MQHLAASVGRLRVDLTYSGSTPPSVPGVTVTSSTAGHAVGFLTPRSAQRFGVALARQARVDAAAGWPERSPLFGSLTRMAAAGSGAVVSPQFPMKTLVIRAVSHSGKPMPFREGLLMNAEDGRRFMSFFSIENGQSRVSVPVGRYAAITTEDGFSRSGMSVRFMITTDFRVSRSMQTMTLDARKATVSPRVTGLRRATLQDLQLGVVAGDESGHASVGWFVSGSPSDTKVYLPPTAPPRFGTLRQETTLNAQDESVPGGRYRVDGGWTRRGVPADQRFAVPPRRRMDLTRTRYFTDVRRRVGGTARAVFPPGSDFASATFWPTPMPLTRREYAFGGRGTMIANSVLTDYDNFNDPGFWDEPPRWVRRGASRSTTWLRNPFQQTVPDPVLSSPFTFSFACRTATDLALVLLPVDNVATHIGEVSGDRKGRPVAHFTLSRNGHTLVDDDDRLGAIVPAGSGRATYRAVATLDRRLARPALSTSLRTDLTFVSGATTGAPAPRRWNCEAGRRSTLLPVLRALVSLHGTSTGAVPRGRRPVDLDIGYPVRAGRARVRSVAVRVSVTGRNDWTRMRARHVSGRHYRAFVDTRAWRSGVVMDMQVVARDARQGMLRQTTTRAFRIGQ